MSQSFRIAMVAACPFPGEQTRIPRMAEALALRGHDVHVVTYHLGGNQTSLPYHVHRIPRVPTYRKLSPGPTYQKLLVVDPLLAMKLCEVLKAHQVDLIHAHHYEGLLTAGLAQRRFHQPIVYDAHTLLESELHFYRMGLSHKLSRRLGRWLDRHIPKLATHTIAVTARIRDKLIEHNAALPDDITVVPSGVEWEHFSNMPDEPAKKNGEKTLVFSGNLASYQGLSLLLKAFQQVRDVRQDVRLLLVSNSPFGEFERLADALGVYPHIDFVRSDFALLPQQLARADVTLNPRVECDGLPIKVLNYMAAAKPTVSFEASAHSLEHGKTGLVVQNGNYQAFANATLRLLDDPELARRLGANARAYARAEYSWETAIERIEAVYQRITPVGQRNPQLAPDE